MTFLKILIAKKNMRTVDGEHFPRMAPTHLVQFFKSLGGSVWLGAHVVAAGHKSSKMKMDAS